MAGCTGGHHLTERAPGSNPLLTDAFTADPAPLVVGDTVYLYTTHDIATGDVLYAMNDWLVYSSQDLRHWQSHGPAMRETDFSWALANNSAWAAQAVEKDGKFYFYAPVKHKDPDRGFAIGVGVSNSATGPFVDARGSALVTNGMTTVGRDYDQDIDPTVFIDDDGTPWLMWGHFTCFLVKLKPNMTELDGEIRTIELPDFTEGPWLFKREGRYYLAYASIDEDNPGNERIAYAMAPSITGPWQYKGLITGETRNSFTIHPGIIEFKDQWYFFYHDALLTIGDLKPATGRRAIAVEYLDFNPDGTIRPVTQTDAGISVQPAVHGGVAQ
ncbi:glycoside hydrolase family 43 protein [Croceibacterium salegens]|nr:glycoside hydrolase family 43 protein [Croceibacterium salegens]